MKILLWLFYPLIEAYIQSRLIKQGKTPNYNILFILRGMAIILFGALVMDAQYDISTVYLITFQICSFWVLFDHILNYFRQKPFLYKGKNSGWIDRLPLGIWITGKFVALVLAIFCYYRLL